MENIVNKNGWFWLAPQYFNQWRVFPRAFIIFYFWLCMETALWFMGLPVPGAAQAAFASAVVSAGAAWFGLYVNSGPAKQDAPSGLQSVEPAHTTPINMDGEGPEQTTPINMDGEGPKG
jgi:hypothetical protein